jgi:hypothetical protein
MGIRYSLVNLSIRRTTSMPKKKCSSAKVTL